MSWKSNLQVYVDPSIKSNHKDLYFDVEAAFSKMGSEITNTVSEIRDIEIPLVIFLDENSDELLLKYANDIKNFVVKIDDANLPLFSESSNEFSHYLIKDRDEIDKLLETILFFLHYQMKFTMNKMVTASEKTMKQIFSRKMFENLNHSDIWTDINKFEDQVYRYNKVDEIQSFINTSSDCVLLGKIQLLSLSDFLIRNNTENYLPVPVTDEEYLFLVWDTDTSDNLVVMSYAILQECFSNQIVLFDSKLLKKRWEKVFSLVPVPIVIFDEEGELIIHNSEFSKLDLGYKKCDEILHEEQITIKKSIYRVLRRKVANRYNEFLFIPVDDFIVGNSATSSEELGIISSSIAHEINNPLAGILAAIDFLTIDDVTEEVKLELLEMKGGILRCKKLISTFLGFSQLHTENISPDEASLLLKDSIEQSMDLIRFRLIENNIQIQIQHKGEGDYRYSLNPHVFSMIFYLILGDIVTNVSHHSLVIRKSHNQIPLTVLEKNNGLEVSLPGKIELSSSFLNSKLMGHLLDITHMQSFSEPGKLFLTRNN